MSDDVFIGAIGGSTVVVSGPMQAAFAQAAELRKQSFHIVGSKRIERGVAIAMTLHEDGPVV